MASMTTVNGSLSTKKNKNERPGKSKSYQVISKSSFERNDEPLKHSKSAQINTHRSPKKSRDAGTDKITESFNDDVCPRPIFCVPRLSITSVLVPTPNTQLNANIPFYQDTNVPKTNIKPYLGDSVYSDDANIQAVVFETCNQRVDTKSKEVSDSYKQVHLDYSNVSHIDTDHDIKKEGTSSDDATRTTRSTSIETDGLNVLKDCKVADHITQAVDGNAGYDKHESQQDGKRISKTKHTSSYKIHDEREDGDGQDTIGNPANDEDGVEADDGGVETGMVPSVSSSTGSTMSLDSSSIPLSSNCSSTSTSTHSITSDIGGRRDFVVLHTDNDSNEAARYIYQVEELCAQDSDIYPPVSIDMLSNIEAGSSELGILGTLHDKYRYILTFVTHDLQSDVYTQFRNEVLITFGLQEGGNKVHRVIPVWAIRKRDCTSALLCLKCLNGFDYINNRNRNDTGGPRIYYKNAITRTVKDGRIKFP